MNPITVPALVRCEVLIPHCRTINGTLYMLEPMFSGIVALPDDDDTRRSIAGGLLRMSQNAEPEPRRACEP
jgi:hypothetical protein